MIVVVVIVDGEIADGRIGAVIEQASLVETELLVGLEQRVALDLLQLTIKAQKIALCVRDQRAQPDHNSGNSSPTRTLHLHLAQSVMCNKCHKSGKSSDGK